MQPFLTGDLPMDDTRASGGDREIDGKSWQFRVANQSTEAGVRRAFSRGNAGRGSDDEDCPPPVCWRDISRILDRFFALLAFSILMIMTIWLALKLS